MFRVVWRKRNLKGVVNALTITVSLGLKGEEELKKIRKKQGRGWRSGWIGEENGHKGSIRWRCILKST